MSNFDTDEHRFAALAYLDKHHSDSEPRVDHVEAPDKRAGRDVWLFCIDGGTVTIEVDADSGDCQLKADNRLIHDWIETEGNL
jgi:hypothetical protein